MNIQSIKSSITHTTQVLKESANHRVDVVERAAEIYNYSPTKKSVKKLTGRISGYFAPIMAKIKRESPTASAISSTYKEVSTNIAKAKRTASETGESRIKGAFKGIGQSKSALTNGLKEIAGINDVILAKQEAGTKQAILESGKSALRLTTSAILSAICTPVPIPGAMVGGWVAGEKITEKLVGKPFSQQIAKLK